MECILIYEIDDHPGNGGGIKFKTYLNQMTLIEGINNLAKNYKEKFKVKFVALIHTEFKVEPKTYIDEFILTNKHN